MKEEAGFLPVSDSLFPLQGHCLQIKNADCILYVDKGDILERGNHDELMEQKGEYYKLYMSQYDFLK